EPRTIRVARSSDGFTWKPDDAILIRGESATGADVSGANLWVHGESLRVVYHGSSGAIYARNVNVQLTAVGDARELHSLKGASNFERVAAPQIVESGDRVHLFYETGARLTATIASTSAFFCD
ncbi:MAG: hypothetical protein LH624_12210, partial [Cryobacterium sp.]|nr:hypothetical protein [Cryobacterium sp.]